MAVNNTQGSFPKMEFPLAMQRQDAFALDPSTVWASLEAAQSYAQSDPTAYVGQILSVVTDGVAAQYQIRDTAGTLEPLGSGAVETATEDEVTEMLSEIFG